MLKPLSINTMLTIFSSLEHLIFLFFLTACGFVCVEHVVYGLNALGVHAETRGRHSATCSIILNVIPSGQGLSPNLVLGWQPAKPSRFSSLGWG